MTDLTETVTVVVSRDLAKKARIVAAEDGWKGRSALMRALLENYLETRQPGGNGAPARIETLYPTAVPIREDR